MKNYLAIYTGSDKSAAHQEWNQLSPEARKERERAGMTSWMEWGREHQGVVVQQGGPLGKTKRVDKSGVIDIKNQMAAWTLVQAESHDAAAKLFINHPHFAIFPGDGVEVMECLQVPGRP